MNFSCIFPKCSVSCIIFGIKIFAAPIATTLYRFLQNDVAEKEAQGRKACFLTPNEAAEKNRQPRLF